MSLRYFDINLLGDDQDKELVFIDREPEGLERFGFRIAEGKAVADVYPEDARIYLAPHSPGLRLSTFLGNSIGYLIVHTSLVERLKQFDLGSVEIFPVSVYNQRKRLHSKDYWIVNPLSIVDCLDRQASQIKYLSSDPSKIVHVNEIVLDSRRVAAAPDLFRIPERRMGYILSERVVQSMQGQGFDNLYLHELSVRP